MSNTSALVLSFLGLAALSYIVRKVGIKRYSISLGLGHLLFIVIMACIYVSGTKDAQHQLFWILPGTVDLPISLLVNILTPRSMTMFVLLLAILGSMQYAAIGWIIDFKLSKDRKSLLPSKRFILLGSLVLIGLGYWAYTSVSYLRLPDYEKAEIELRKANNDFDRFMALEDATRSYYKYEKYSEARNRAEQLLTLSLANKSDYNIYGDGYYTAHTILGRLDLHAGRPEQAIQHLFESVKTPGSAVLASFGPDMSLANDLLDKGYKAPVIKFLNGCKRFWEYEEGKLDTWIKYINDGKKPDFSLNLRS
jgi:tetratricopeptide (TPR) repeat protein